MTKENYGPYWLTESKICPLTGDEVCGDSSYACINSDCRNVQNNVRYYLHGHTYRCQRERQEIEDWHEKRVKAAETYKRLNQSLETARRINVDEFFADCDSLDEEMTKSRQPYNKDMVLTPYHDPDEKCLMYLFEDDEVVEISTVDNPFTYLSTRFDRLRDETKRFEVSCCAVPAYMSEAVNVRQHLLHKMDVKAVLHNDNPVYIKARNIGKYIDAAYGWDWLSFKKVRDQHLEMTEIVNYDNIIYIKQELDEIIRRES